MPPTPDVIAHQDHLAKLELEVLKLRAEVETKRMQRDADRAQLAKLDELVADMKQRPIFRAIDSSQNVAFVPHTQLDGMRTDALVIECKLWGLFRCQPAGRVAELVPGEFVSVDPFGVPARGQYAILALSEPRAAESKSLRVRLPPSPGKPPDAIEPHLNRLRRSRSGDPCSRLSVAASWGSAGNTGWYRASPTA